MHLRTQDLLQRQIEVTIHQYSITKTYIHGVNVHIMYLIVVLKLVKGISTYWWNANNWDNAAAADGYTIDNRPTVGSIAQTDVGYYGHVMFVERVNNDGSILVSEMNYSAAPGILTYRTVPATK